MSKIEKDKQDMIYGIRPLMEAIDSGKEIEKVLLQKGVKSDLFKDLMKLLFKFDEFITIEFSEFIFPT